MRTLTLLVLILVPLCPAKEVTLRVAMPLATECDFPVFDEPVSLWLPPPEAAPPPLRCRIRAFARR